MYTDVHMITNITDFRKNIFKYAKRSEEIEVEKDGKRIWRIVPIEEQSPQERAKYVLEHVLPKLAGVWKDVPQEEIDKIYAYRRSPRERNYWKRKRFKW